MPHMRYHQRCLTEQMEDHLVLGPLMRYVDETSASIWVETAQSATVTVEAGERSWSARTFAVHGHHYALVECDGLEPASITAYAVRIDDVVVWPQASEYDLPEPVIATLDPDRRLRLAFGSCRTSVPHDEPGNKTHGVDALLAFALRLAQVPQTERPDLIAFLGDQVYADETTAEMREFIESRRDIEQAPWTELKDYEEYAHLYTLAWCHPVLRWLLSTVPSSMIFDDHDVRDDWNTSQEWREEMQATSWWHGRIVAALSSYWVYQHLGNLSPADRAEDEIWSRIAAHDGPEELDLSETLDEFAERTDADPEAYRWSYARELPGARLVVLDTRAARVLEPGSRAMLDATEMGWLEEHLRGDVEHLLIGTSLPFMLPPGLHDLEALDEAMADGLFGHRAQRVGEWLRTTVDLEHWAAFQASFAKVSESAIEVAQGRRGAPPRSVTFLGGDVHHSYASRVTHTTSGEPLASAIVQAVCSPIRNPLPRWMRFVTAALSYGLGTPLGVVAAKSRRVPDPPMRWERLRGPWFDNNIAVLDVVEHGLDLSWFRGSVRRRAHDRPVCERVAHVPIPLLPMADLPAHERTGESLTG